MISPRPWLEHLFDHVPIARAGVEDEGIHQVRVATRRLDAWLRLGRLRVLRDDLRWLRRVAGEVRDLDVLLAAHPDESLAAWLRDQRRHAHASFVRALDDARWDGLREALVLLPPLDVDAARRGLRAFVKRVARAEQELGDGPEVDDATFERWHALRRAVRRLRYGLEWLELDASAAEELQDEFGELGDLALARRVFARHPDPDVAGEHTARVADGLGAAFARAKEGWRSRRNAVLGSDEWTSS